MAKYKDIFEVEKQREDAAQWNVIHLFKEGTTYKAHEWSAYLAREFASTEEWRRQVGANPLKPVHKLVGNSSGSIIFVGFPLTSIDKFIQKDLQMSFTPVGDDRIDIAIELPAEQFSDMTLEKMQERVKEWKQQFPVKKSGDNGNGGSAQKSNNGTAADGTDDLLALLTGQPARPMRMSDILAQIVALPLDDITPNAAQKVLRILQRQCSALF